MAIFFAAAIWPHKSTRRWPRITAVFSCAIVFLAATAAAGELFFQPCDEEDNIPEMLDVYRTGAGFAGTDEYAPPGADNYEVATGLPAACLVDDPSTVLGKSEIDAPPAWDAAQVSCKAVFPSGLESSRTRPENMRVVAKITHAGYLILRLRSYPAWQVTVNGRHITNLPRRDDGLLAVPVPQGSIDLAVTWTTTPDVVAGRCLSALAVLLLAVLYLFERKLTRARLSSGQCQST